MFDFEKFPVKRAEKLLRGRVYRLQNLLEQESVNSNRKGYEKLQKILSHSMPKLYRAYDVYIKRLLKTSPNQISCKSGCSHCCSHYVTSVESFELVYLHNQIKNRDNYINTLFELHHRTGHFMNIARDARDESDEDAALHGYFLYNKPCPFLSREGNCGVYEHRPMSCRMFFSYSDPRYCRGLWTTSEYNRNFIIELPDDIENAFSRITHLIPWGLSEHLFQGLTETNENFGKFDGMEDND